MVVIVRGEANHSNRIFQAVHIEAYCLEHNIRFYNPSFHDMAKLYGLKSHFYDSVLCLTVRVLNKLGVVRVLHCDVFDDNGEYHSTLGKKKVTFIDGWCFRAHDLTEKHQDYFARKYRVRDEFIGENEMLTFVNRKKEARETLVGVHIRRKDYREFEQGKFFFDDEVYLKNIGKLVGLIRSSSGRDPIVILFSDENVTIPIVYNLVISKNPWYIDQLVMSKCDYLMGPPSTFTLWASYYGKVKYYHMYDAHRDFSLSDFKICTG